MEGLRQIADGIDDLYLKKIAMREVIFIEESMIKWQTRVEEMKKNGWCYMDDKKELASLIMKESEETQKELNCIDFWVERWKDDQVHQRLQEINKSLLQRKDRQIKITRFFVISKETFARDKIKEIIRSQRRELICESNRAELVVILRHEFKEWQPELCKKLQHFTVFDDSLVVLEMTDQFGETTGTGPIIGRKITVTEEEKREKGIQGDVNTYLETISALKEFATQRHPSILRIV
ncbi:MAG: hypothetical protein QME49_01780 [bacterium]|nr:hypothetical protein [bacterium]